jgi:hypothetical protein
MPNLKSIIFKRSGFIFGVTETVLDVYNRCQDPTKAPVFDELAKDEMERLPGMVEGRSTSAQVIARLRQ